MKLLEAVNLSQLIYICIYLFQSDWHKKKKNLAQKIASISAWKKINVNFTSRSTATLTETWILLVSSVWMLEMQPEFCQLMVDHGFDHEGSWANSYFSLQCSFEVQWWRRINNREVGSGGNKGSWATAVSGAY